MDPLQEELQRTRKALERQNELLEKWIQVESNWKRKLLQAMFNGLMTVVGATLLVSLLVRVLLPLSGFDQLKPTIERLTEALQQPRK